MQNNFDEIKSGLKRTPRAPIIIWHKLIPSWSLYSAPKNLQTYLCKVSSLVQNKSTKENKGLAECGFLAFWDTDLRFFGFEVVWSRNPKAWGTTEIRVHEPTVKGKA
jgi:hypothetical protein